MRNTQMKSLLHIHTIFHGWFYHTTETVEVKKSEGASSNGKSFDGTRQYMGTKISSGPPSFHRP